MNKGLRIAIAAVLLLGILVLARGQMAWAGGIPASISDAQANFAQTGATPVPTQGSGGSLTAKLSEITGPVQVKEAQDVSFSKATPGYTLELLGQAQTETGGKVRLDFSTGTLVRLGPNTLFTLQPAQDNSQGLGARLQMTLGKLWVILKGGSLEVETPSGVAAVQGSYLSVWYDPVTGQLRITCLEGHCSESNDGGIVQITSGQTAVTHGRSDPPKIGVMTDQDYQDWLGNNPESAGLVRQASTVQVPSTVLPLIAVTGAYSVGGVCTFRVLELAQDVSLNADLLPYESLGKRPDGISGYLAGVCRAVYNQGSKGVIDTLGTDSQVQVCFAPGPDATGTIYVYNPWQTAVGPSTGETWTPLPTTPDGGLLCAPAQQTGKYFLASQNP
jgi:hypothetical protein